MSLCAVIPAAGAGHRLGLDVPKLLLPLGRGRTVWTTLRDRLQHVADHVVVVLSPRAVPLFEQAARDDLASGRVSYRVQAEPRGMGAAVALGAEAFRHHQALLVVWGDQAGVSSRTLAATGDALRSAGDSPRVVLPLVQVDRPYVQYVFDDAGRLARVRQSREGDACDPAGLSDVGTFGLSTRAYDGDWARYLAARAVGERTSEVNFLPFLAHLSCAAGWPVTRIDVPDAEEARGINTREDLAFFRARFGRDVE